MKNFLKFLGVIALAAIIGFSMAACSSSSDGDDDGDRDDGIDDGIEKSITITGISETNYASILVLSAKGIVAFGTGTISDGSAVFKLVNHQDNNPWTRSGSYYLQLDTDIGQYYYTNGSTFASLGIKEDSDFKYVLKTLPKYNISSASSSIASSQFAKIPDEWK